MSYSTETLIKLRALTGQGRSKANVTVPTEQRKYKSKFSYNIRPNKVTVLSNVNFDGNYSFQVPSFKVRMARRGPDERPGLRGTARGYLGQLQAREQFGR